MYWPSNRTSHWGRFTKLIYWPICQTVILWHIQTCWIWQILRKTHLNIIQRFAVVLVHRQSTRHNVRSFVQRPKKKMSPFQANFLSLLLLDVDLKVWSEFKTAIHPNRALCGAEKCLEAATMAASGAVRLVWCFLRSAPTGEAKKEKKFLNQGMFFGSPFIFLLRFFYSHTSWKYQQVRNKTEKEGEDGVELVNLLLW